jgi:dCMP deaminase
MSWDDRFLELATVISSWSKDPSTKVGAVIVDDDNRVISIGYNGFPKGIKDDHRLSNRDLKYEMIVHAEANALLFANAPVKGCTIYTWPFQPCSRCASLIIQAGVRRVVSVENKDQKWSSNFQLAQDMLTEARVEVETYLTVA